MDKEILRKQIFDETHAQFESKLREAKRQKAQVEAELEGASERWRAERRRLNSEIDRLESEVADAKESKKRTASKGDSGVDPAELAKIQAAADEKYQKACHDWETERAEMRKEISRLERTLADLLERSNNPLRRSPPLQERVENRIEENKAALELTKARSEWEAERKELQAEISKLRQELDVLKREGERATKKSLEQQSSSTTIAEQLREAMQQKNSLEQQLEAANQALQSNLKREGERAAKKSLEQQSSSTAIAEQLREAMQQKNFIEQQLEGANQALQSKRTAHAEEIAALGKQISLLEATLERERSAAPPSAAPPSSSAASDPIALRDEIARIEGMIADINHLVDDPACELSTVIRKNVERAELDAYLKGILFSMGEITGM